LIDDYDFDLPERLIAQRPAPERDASRLLVLDGDRIEHRVFRELPALVRPGDLFVLNETRVIPARLFARRLPGGGRTEILLLHPSHETDPARQRWHALVRPARRVHRGTVLSFGDLGEAVVLATGEEGERELAFTTTLPFERFLEQAGRLPLPPYVRSDDDELQQRYQTVFARVPGSVAAPTASLHFTEELFGALAERGVEFTRLVLDVSLGTFRPVKSERLAEHRMYAERYTIPEECALAVRSAKETGRRVVAVGTTVVRALEASALRYGEVRAGEEETDLFITPGFRFRVTDAMITNFHLPRSTLLVLVSAFAGRERILRAYREAIARDYRFFSFGDAMFITPERGSP